MDYCTEIDRLLTEAHAIPQPRDRAASRRHDALYSRAAELKHDAAKDFAALNGWTHTKTNGFSVETLIKGGVHDREWSACSLQQHHHMRLFDHGLHFRQKGRPYRSIAIVGQPYNTSLEEAETFAAEHGLEVHTPDPLTASFHFPGATRMFCFVRPGTRVQFLLTSFKPYTPGQTSLAARVMHG